MPDIPPSADEVSKPADFGFWTTADFIVELHTRLAAATSSISIQLMTFDGDASGLAIAELLIAAARRGVEVRLIIDCFAHRFVSDRPVTDRTVSAEYLRTTKMYSELAAAGIGMRYTNPNGPLHVFSLARNHKKLYLIDDLVYIGGINISDHNFGWHDFMISTSDPSVHGAVLADFEATFSGRRTAVDGHIITNGSLETTFDSLVAGAKERIVVASPYALDLGLVRAFESASAPSKTMVVAGHNNFRFLQAVTPYLSRRLQRAGVDLVVYRQFSHAKFLLVDDDVLLVGSSNFGRHSFWCNAEIGIRIRDRAFIARFEAEMLDDMAPFAPSTNLALGAFGAVASAGMIGYLRLYARFIASRAKPLVLPGQRPG